MKFIRGKFKRSDIKTNERIIILGRTGTGKSVLTDTLLEYLGRKVFIVLIDVKDEYIHIPTLDFKTFFTKKKGVVRINRLKIKTNIQIVDTDDLFKVTEFIASNLFKYNQKLKEAGKPLRRAMICVEELGSVCRKGGRLYDVMYNTAKVISQGRGVEIGFIGISQRPQQVHTDFLSQSDHIISFEVSSKHDLDAMKSYFSKEQYESLQRFEFIHYKIKSGSVKHCYPLYENELYHSLDYYRNLFGRS
ncbi:MAG: helicase HerA domain-containing protein [Promethearchaeota archaeon]